MKQPRLRKPARRAAAIQRLPVGFSQHGILEKTLEIVTEFKSLPSPQLFPPILIHGPEGAGKQFLGRFAKDQLLPKMALKLIRCEVLSSDWAPSNDFQSKKQCILLTGIDRLTDMQQHRLADHIEIAKELGTLIICCADIALTHEVEVNMHLGLLPKPPLTDYLLRRFAERDIVFVRPLSARQFDALALAALCCTKLSSIDGVPILIARDLPPLLMFKRWPTNVAGLISTMTRAVTKMRAQSENVLNASHFAEIAEQDDLGVIGSDVLGSVQSIGLESRCLGDANAKAALVAVPLEYVPSLALPPTGNLSDWVNMGPWYWDHSFTVEPAQLMETNAAYWEFQKRLYLEFTDPEEVEGYVFGYIQSRNPDAAGFESVNATIARLRGKATTKSESTRAQFAACEALPRLMPPTRKDQELLWEAWHPIDPEPIRVTADHRRIVDIEGRVLHHIDSSDFGMVDLLLKHADKEDGWVETQTIEEETGKSPNQFFRTAKGRSLRREYIENQRGRWRFRPPVEIVPV